MRTKLAVVTLSLAVSGCSSCKKEAASAPAPVVAPAVVEAPKSAIEQVPLTDATLSLFEPKDGKCEWVRADPVAKKRSVVAGFDGDCRGARVAFSPDWKKALVWFDPATVQRPGYFATTATASVYPEETPVDGAAPRLYEVTFAASTAQALPTLKVRGELREAAIGPSGDPMVFTEEALSDVQAGGESIDVDGEPVTIEKPDEGIPALAHAYRLRDGAWKRAETKFTTTSWDYALGWRATEAASKLGARSVELLAAHTQGDGVEDAALLERLMALAPKAATPDDGNWIWAGKAAVPVYVWEIRGEFAYTTGLVVLDDGKALTPLPELGFTDGDLVSVAISGAYLMVSSQSAGTHPRLYDTATGKRVFASDTARAAVIWPRDRKPDHAD